MKAKEREALTPIALRKRAAEYAGEAINTQREVRTFDHTYLHTSCILFYILLNELTVKCRILITFNNDKYLLHHIMKYLVIQTIWCVG